MIIKVTRYTNIAKLILSIDTKLINLKIIWFTFKKKKIGKNKVEIKYTLIILIFKKSSGFNNNKVNVKEKKQDVVSMSKTMISL